MPGRVIPVIAIEFFDEFSNKRLSIHDRQATSLFRLKHPLELPTAVLKDEVHSVLLNTSPSPADEVELLTIDSRKSDGPMGAAEIADDHLSVMLGIMCGRYRIKENDVLTAQLRDLFGIPDWVQDNNVPRYNIGPGQDIGTVLTGKDGAVKTIRMRWGLVPFWESAPSSKLVINARSETAFEKGMFRDAVQRRRCLVPADGFYEWKRLDEGKTKLPFDIHLRGERPFFIAGIFEYPKDTRPATCFVFTTQPNEVMAPIHDRMPVILEPEQAKAWIGKGEIAKGRYEGLMQPYPAAEMEAVPISSLVNSVKNDGPEVLAPVAHGAAEPKPIRKQDLQGELGLF